MLSIENRFSKMKQTLEEISVFTSNRYCRAFSVTAFLALLVFLFFYKILIFPEKFHIPFDLHGFHYPQAYEIFAALKQGYFPLWDPYAYSGMPLAGNITAQLFYPPNIFFLKLSDWIYGTLPFRMLEYQLISHYLLAGIGAYLLARSFCASIQASILAAVIYQFGGFFASQTQHLGLIDGAAWAPFLLFFLKRAYETRSLIFVSLSGLSLALIILAGFPALAVVTLTILSFCCVSIFVSDIQFSGVKDAARILMFLLLILIFSFGFAAIQILPAVELSNLSISQLRSFYGSIEGLPVEGHLSLIIPSLFGVGSRSYFGVSDFTMIYLYVAIVPLILSVLAIQFRKDKVTLLIVFITIFSLIWSLGTLTPVSTWLWIFIPHSLKGAIYPFCAKLFFDLGISLLAAFGLDCLRNRLKKEDLRKIKGLTKYLLFLLSGLLLVDIFVYAQASTLNEALERLHFFNFVQGINTLILLLALFVAALYFRASHRISPSVFSVLLILITLFDLFSFGSGKTFNTFEANSEEFLTTRTIDGNSYPI
ncbi:MAG TPA: hypothetical protein VLH08_19340, partial [Acidobacteriota bacterium]|nr:hypothetical protein [Acidobacteriota bacterium]